MSNPGELLSILICNPRPLGVEHCRLFCTHYAVEILQFSEDRSKLISKSLRIHHQLIPVIEMMIIPIHSVTLNRTHLNRWDLQLVVDDDDNPMCTYKTSKPVKKTQPFQRLICKTEFRTTVVLKSHFKRLGLMSCMHPANYESKNDGMLKSWSQLSVNWEARLSKVCSGLYKQKLTAWPAHIASTWSKGNLLTVDFHLTFVPIWCYLIRRSDIFCHILSETMWSRCWLRFSSLRL